MINRIKFKLLVTIESIMEGNRSSLLLKRVTQSVPYVSLMINLIENYENFKKIQNGAYTEELFKQINGDDNED
jgi:hypothetical protein